mgnify:CR=1 FL=1
MKIKNIAISTLITLIIGFIINYLFLPPWNLQAKSFWLFIIILIGIFSIVSAIISEIKSDNYKVSKVTAISGLVIFLIFLVMTFTSNKLVNSKKYSNMLEDYVREENFSTYEATLDNIPLLDKNSSMLITNRKLGSLIDVVSQFEIDDSEQITVKGNPVRVSILEYGSFFKWINNRGTGTPGYIMVDMKTQDAELIRTDGGIKYTQSEYFGRNLDRYLRFSFPTAIFEQPTLELDEDGHPYWLAPIVDYTIGLFGGKDISGAVTVDAVTGEIERYNVGNIPQWLDNVYPSDLIMEQYDNYGKYQSGYWNSRFGQKGVKVTTDGYNYIPLGNDNWIYTGVTSAGKDESNIGFILINKRNKETIYYPVSGAEEFSAMASAEGVVQHLDYISTFPLLLKIEGQPTYLVALKDAAGLVKMFGMINVGKYQIVATGETIADCQTKYRELLRNSGTNIFDSESEKVNGTITDIRQASKEGTTYYYIQLNNKDIYYSLSILDNEEAILLNIGDRVTLNIVAGKDRKIISALLYE